jgi:hypothetical protein
MDVVLLQTDPLPMADGEDVQPLVCDNGSGMVKVRLSLSIVLSFFLFLFFSVSVVPELSIVEFYFLSFGFCL